MSFAQFQNLLDEVGDTLILLALWNYGESLLNPEIFKMIRYAKEKRVVVTLSTNATLLDDERSESIIDSGLDYLIVSMDGASKATYEKYRPPAHFETILQNVKRLMDWRQQKLTWHPFVDLQLIAMRENTSEIQEMRRLAVDLGVDRLTVKKADYIPSDLRETLLPVQTSHRCSHYDKKEEALSYCTRLTLSSVINANGDVVPCCSDIEFQHVFGNVFRDGGFKAIWNNAQYQAFRQQDWNQPGSIDICKNCEARSFSTGIVVQTQAKP